MTIEQHLVDRLENPQTFPLNEEELKRIKFEGIAAHTYKRLTSTKFRRTSLDHDAEAQLRKAIKINVDAQLPIKFTYPFGGYKTFRVPGFPYVDWAEFLAISHLIRYVKFVVAGYNPGAEIYFSSDDVIIEKIDNYKRKDLDSYTESFQKLINEFSKYLPGNIKLSLKRVVPDIYEIEAYRKELELIVDSLRKQGISPEIRKTLKRGFDFNFRLDGRVDYSKINQAELDKIVEDLMYYSDGYLKLRKRRDFVRGEDKVVVFSNKIPNAVDIGSTTVSRAKFWVGTGVIEAVNGKIYDRILSPKQFDSTCARAKPYKVNVIDMPNFKEILVFNERLNFRA